MASERIEPFLVTILARRFEAITRDMTNTLLRTGRSGVLAVARDFSSSILTGDSRQLMVEEGLPLHLVTSEFIPKAVLDFFDDIAPGDCFMNNCPYTGNTHHADVTVSVPVFYRGELLFWTMSRAHQADIGAPIPTTYLPYAKDIYEEGLHFPCVRVQRNYKDLADIIRMCRMKIRVPEQWYGDYLAQIGAVRIGERRILELCGKYGAQMLKAFVEQWMDYGERRAVEEIGKLPRVTLEGETRHDPLSFAPDGIPVKVKVAIDPDEGYITVDLTDNPDNYPGGMNLSVATAMAGAYIGVLNNLDPTVPHNAGCFKRIRVKLREGCAVWIPKFPVGTSVATTNLCDRLINAVQSAFARIGPPYGLAEGSPGQAPSVSVISGTDWRRADAPYVNQLILGFGGGPAVHGHDGWLTYALPVTGGVLYCDSVELDEQRFPILFDRLEIVPDHLGSGRWDGAPGVLTVYGPRRDPMVAAYVTDGTRFPPRGVAGGLPGGPGGAWKIGEGENEEELPLISAEVIRPGEKLVSRSPGGGGYGNPLERDPELVREKVREGWITVERAREVYGVVLDTRPETFAVDCEATDRERRGRA